jgi:uncharacterized membrane protein
MKAITAAFLLAAVTVGNTGMALADDETHGRHNHPGGVHAGHERFDIGGSTPTIILGAAILVASALVAFVLLKKRRNGDRQAEESLEQEALDNLEGQIMAMLNEYGGALTQDTIRDNLGLPLAVVSSALLEMEKAGRITREWEIKEYTFRVKRT